MNSTVCSLTHHTY